MTPYVSVCIPTFEMKGFGRLFLRQSFDVLSAQAFKQFEVVVSDHSKSNDIRNLCEDFADRFDIRYFRNTDRIGNSSVNLNNAIQHSSGKLIKILFQDDFLFDDSSLAEIVAGFDLKKDHWLVTACEHTIDGVHFIRPFFPVYNDHIHLGNNTISSPSVLTILNQNPLLFDENLIWLMDCDYYKRCHDVFGGPKILPRINVVNRIGPHQVSNTLADETRRKKELKYIRKKYHELPFVSTAFRFLRSRL